MAVVKKRVKIRRENSSHGRKDALLVTGPSFKPLFVPFTEFIKNSKKEMIKADAEDLAASQRARSEKSNLETLRSRRQHPIGPGGKAADGADPAGK